VFSEAGAYAQSALFSHSQKLFPPGLANPTSLAADPRQSMMLYAAACNASWRSVEAGVTWSILFQFSSDVTSARRAEIHLGLLVESTEDSYARLKPGAAR
jgi:hypothetical protein